MSFFSEERAAELRDLFFESAQELLQALNEQGLELERSPGDSEVVRGIRRTIHTLKGDSAACGFKELSELAHELEDALKPELVATAGNALAELVLSSADMFDAMLAAYRGKMQPPKADPLRAMISRLLNNPLTASTQDELKPQFEWSEYDRLAMEGALALGNNVYNIALSIDRACPMRGAAVQLVLNVIAETGSVLARFPDEIPADGSLDVVEVAVSSKLNEAEIQVKCAVPTIVDKAIIQRWSPQAGKPQPSQNESDVLGLGEALGAPPVAEASSLEVQEASTTAVQPASETQSKLKPKAAELASPENTLRVDAERIDIVMNLVGELIIGKSMLYQTINEFGRRYPKDPLRNRFSDAMSKQAQVLNALQRSVMKIRMVPVDQLFRRFPRVLRDAAKACGKDVELVTVGQDTDLDKGILDALAEPLTHLLRNAVDHGIETAQERIAKGKPPQGFIKLNAYHQANHVVIELTDDGRGIDPEKVAAKAIQRGMLSADDAARLTDAQKMELIFESGFSTAEQVTSISGRGVGMDVVRSVLGRLKGTVQIISNIDKGTTFRLTMPLTLAIIKAMLFAVGEQSFAVPLNTVVEITRAHIEQVHRIDNCEVLQLREEVITLARLSRMMPEAHESSISKFFVVVVGLGERKFGLIVDKLIGEDELVIKAMDDQLVATDLVSGASILGDGTVVLILNIPALVDRVGFVRTPMAGMPLVPQSEGVSAAL